ncbi:MAG: O-antigen ligase family protein [Opitutales bacterium]
MSKLAIPLREKLVAVSGGLTLAYTAWGFGGVIAWSLHAMLAGGLLTLVLAVLPWPRKWSPGSGMPDTGNASSSVAATSPFANLRRLLATPACYFALAFLAYLAVSALNPAWRMEFDERGWWLVPMSPPLAAWLPTSVESPYQPMNAWRIFNMHLAALSLSLGFYNCLRSRRAILIVIWSFVTSVSLMAAVAIVQKYTGADAVLWSIKSENRNFWGSFFYRNQAVAFLNWGIVISGVLFFCHARRVRAEAGTGGPHFLAFCLIGLIAVSVGLALSRGGILFAAILVCLFLILVLFDFSLSTFHFPLSTLLPLALILTSLLSAGIWQAGKAIDWEAVEKRFGDIEATIQDADKDARALSSKLTWKMGQDQRWTGWGAGSFRYAFPMYQQEMNELFYRRYHQKKGWIGRKYYRYAHNDIFQFLAEYGIIGCGLLFFAILSLMLPAWKAVFHLPLATFFFFAGLACVVAHAFLDFIFHSPAYWVALIAGIALASQLIRIEAKRA